MGGRRREFGIHQPIHSPSFPALSWATSLAVATLPAWPEVCHSALPCFCPHQVASPRGSSSCLAAKTIRLFRQLLMQPLLMSSSIQFPGSWDSVVSLCSSSLRNGSSFLQLLISGFPHLPLALALVTSLQFTCYIKFPLLNSLPWDLLSRLHPD